MTNYEHGSEQRAAGGRAGPLSDWIECMDDITLVHRSSSWSSLGSVGGQGFIAAFAKLRFTICLELASYLNELVEEIDASQSTADQLVRGTLIGLAQRVNFGPSNAWILTFGNTTRCGSHQIGNLRICCGVVNVHVAR
jgi:hypothetical protein